MHESVDAVLDAGDLEELSARYDASAYPMLEAVTLDPRDGIDPLEAACFAVILNPGPRAACANRNFAASQLIQARLLPNPQLSLSADVPSEGATDGAITALGLGAAWDLGALVEHRAQADAAVATDSAAMLDLVWQEWQAANAARLAATKVGWRNKACGLLEQAAQEVSVSAGAIRAACDPVQATDIDASAATATEQAYEAQLRVARRASDLAALEAKRAMGLPPEAGVAFVLSQTSSSDRMGPGLPGLDSLFEEARARRVDLATLRYGYDAQEASVRAAILAQFPRISLGVNWARDTDDVQTVGVGIGIDIPVFDRGQRRIATERATREVLRSEYAQRVFTLRANLAAILTELVCVDSEIEAQQGYAAAKRAALDAATRNEASGMVDVFSIQQLRTESIDAQVGLIDLEQRRAELMVVMAKEAGFTYGDSSR